jgi:hypothetical protein
MRHRLIAIVSATIFAGCAFGQNFTCGGSARFAAARPFSATPGAPYSAEAVAEQVQTLADGTHITRKQPITKVYRDSLGRTRTESPFRGGAGGNCASGTVIEISDPIAGIKYTYALDTIDKVAHRQQMPPYIPQAKQAPAPSAAVTSEKSAPVYRDAEKLGTRTIEGVLAEGVLSTRILPVDSEDNDRPISIVNETWTSVELKEIVLSKHIDPRSGEATQRLTNISLADPAASLFRPPPDYSVVDESGEFTIKWGSQQ